MKSAWPGQFTSCILGTHNVKLATYISVIGDEILKGQIIDSNSHFLCRRLFTLGVDVKKVCLQHSRLANVNSVMLEITFRLQAHGTVSPVTCTVFALTSVTTKQSISSCDIFLAASRACGNFFNVLSMLLFYWGKTEKW